MGVPRLAFIWSQTLKTNPNGAIFYLFEAPGGSAGGVPGKLGGSGGKWRIRGGRDRAPDVVETAHTAGSHGGSVEGLDKINSLSTSA